MHYTPAQTRWFLDAIEDLDVDRHRREVVGARKSQASVAALEQYFAELRRKD